MALERSHVLIVQDDRGVTHHTTVGEIIDLAEPGSGFLEEDANGNVYIDGNLYITGELVHSDDTVVEVDGNVIAVGNGGDITIRGTVFSQISDDKDIHTDAIVDAETWIPVRNVQASVDGNIAIRGHLIVTGNISTNYSLVRLFD